MFKFVSPVTIWFGEGMLHKLAEECAKLDVKNVIIFVDPAILKAGLTEPVEHVLKQANIHYHFYSHIVPEPPLAVANEAVAAVRNSEADMVVAIGGGSAMDMAKAAAVVSAHDGEIADYLHLTGTKKFTNKGLPKILIPTTAGTGSEVTDIAVFTLDSTKDVITHPYLLADIAIVDPELTYSLPTRITAATGVDAFTHAIEAFTSVNASTLTDALALEAIGLVSRQIRKATWQGKDKEARRDMAWASLIAGLAFFNAGAAGVHALAYPIGGLFHVAHGESNAVMLPYVYEYILPSCLDKMERVATAMGVSRNDRSQRKNAWNALKAIKELVVDVGLPLSLQAYRIGEEDIERLAQDGAKQVRLLARSPKPFQLEDIRSVYRQAWEG